MSLPTQIQLVSAILESLGSHPADSQLMNTVIAAANGILAEAHRPRRYADKEMSLQQWLTGDDTGLSSKYMASVLSPTPCSCQMNHPHDGSDFGRCYRLLKSVPALRANIDRLATCPSPWPALHAKWMELEKLYEAMRTETYTRGGTNPKHDAFYLVFDICIGRRTP